MNGKMSMKRLLSSLLVVVFVLTQAVFLNNEDVLYAAKNSKAKEFAPRSEVIPAQFGILTEVYFPQKKYQTQYQKDGLDSVFKKITKEKHPFLFLIEDAHSSIEAQRNIANLIRLINKKWKVKILALEGAEGEIPLQDIWSSPFSKERGEVLDFYLKEALLSGPEYEALRDPDRYQVHGVEMMELYEADRKVYLSVYENRSDFSRKLTRAKKEIRRKKQKTFSKKLLSFDKKEEAFLRNPGRYFKSFVPFVIKTASELGLKPSRDSSLPTINRILGSAQNISLKELAEELALFKKENPMYLGEVEILEKQFLPRGFDFNFEITGPPPEIPTLFLYRYKTMRIFLDTAYARYGINSPQLFSELKGFTEKTKRMLMKTKEEQELNKEAKSFDVLDRILHLEALREDLENPKVRITAGKLGIGAVYDQAALFYELAKKRDETLTLNTLQVMEESKIQPKAAILVAGGFHTAGVQDMLKKSKVGFVTISPKFQSDLSNEKLYRTRLAGDLTLVASAIAPEKLTQDEEFREKLHIVDRMYEKGAEIEEAVGFSLGKTSLLNHPERKKQIRRMIQKNWVLTRKGITQEKRTYKELAEAINKRFFDEEEDGYDYYSVSDAALKQFRKASIAFDNALAQSEEDVRFYLKQRGYYGFSNNPKILKTENPNLYEAAVHFSLIKPLQPDVKGKSLGDLEEARERYRRDARDVFRSPHLLRRIDEAPDIEQLELIMLDAAYFSLILLREPIEKIIGLDEDGQAITKALNYGEAIIRIRPALQSADVDRFTKWKNKFIDDAIDVFQDPELARRLMNEFEFEELHRISWEHLRAVLDELGYKDLPEPQFFYQIVSAYRRYLPEYKKAAGHSLGQIGADDPNAIQFNELYKKAYPDRKNLYRNNKFGYRAVYEAAAGLFGFDAGDDEERYEEGKRLLQLLFDRGLADQAIKELNFFTFTASGAHRFHPLALAITNALDGKDIFSPEKIPNMIQFDETMRYLEDKYHMYADPDLSDLPKVKLVIPRKEEGYRWLDIGSAPKVQGAPTLNFIKNFFEGYQKIPLEVVGTDVFFPRFQENADGTISENEDYNFNKEEPVEFNGVQYKNAALNPEANIMDSSFNLGQFDFISIVKALHHLKHKDELFTYGPLTNLNLQYQKDGKRFGSFPKQYYLTPTQRRVINRLLQSLKVGGTLFLNPTYAFNLPENIPNKEAVYQEGFADRSNADLFLIIQRTAENEFVIYDEAIPYRPNLSPFYAGYVVIDAFPDIFNIPALSSLYPELETDTDLMAQVVDFVKRADAIVYRHQSLDKDAWGSIFQAGQAKKEGKRLPEIMRVYMANVPDGNPKKIALLKGVDEFEAVYARSLGHKVDFTITDAVQAFAKNVLTSEEPAYLILPASELLQIDSDALRTVLSNPYIVIDILWDLKGVAPRERLDYLAEIGWGDYIGKKNFHANLVNKQLDKKRSLKSQAEYVVRILQDKGVSSEQVALLKPESLRERINGVMSLRSDQKEPVSLYLLLYLIQINGDPANNILSDLNLVYDEKTGDFIIIIDEYLAGLILESMAAQALARAA